MTQEPLMTQQEIDAHVRSYGDDRLRAYCAEAAGLLHSSEWHRILLAEMHRRGLTVEGPA